MDRSSTISQSTKPIKKLIFLKKESRQLLAFPVDEAMNKVYYEKDISGTDLYISEGKDNAKSGENLKLMRIAGTLLTRDFYF